MPDWASVEALVDGRLPITYVLIAICTVVSLVGFWALDRERQRSYFVFVPSRVAKGKGWIGAFISHFAHGDGGHLFLNMLALFFFGPGVERALGPLAFLLIYAASGAVGTFAIFVFRRKNPKHSALGASGAIAGVLFASVVITPTASIFLLIVPVPIPAPVFAVLYLVFSSLKMGGRDGVAHEAHLGGALAGLALAGLLFEDHFGPLIDTARQLLSGSGS